MICIYCGSKTNVSNSRSQKRSNSIWRRRVCPSCMATVTTIEKIDLATAVMVTNNSGLQPFSRDKLYVSIFESCKHRNAAVADATHLTDTVIKLLYPQIDGTLLSRHKIIATTSLVLHRFDNAAGVQYAAYHSGVDR